MTRSERRRRAAPTRALRPGLVLGLALVVLLVVGVGFGFAGSSSTLADGVRIAGVDVGGLSVTDARKKLERRSEALASVPVVFRIGARRFRVRPEQLSVSTDW